MPSAFDDVFNTHALDAMNEVFGVSVTFRRGRLTSDTITARRDDREHVAMGQDLGVEIKTEMRVYYLPVASLVLGGQTVTPQKGDQIVEGGSVWTVAAPDDSTPPAEKFGEYDWMIHARIES